VSASSPSRRHLTINLGVLGTGELLARAFTFLAFAHLTRVLEPATFGLVEWTLAVMQLALLAVDQGLGLLGAREVARTPGRTGDLIGRIASAQFSLALGVVTLLVVVATVAPLDPLLRILLTGFSLSLLGVPFLLNWVFQGLNLMLAVAAPQVLRQATFLLITLLAVAGPDELHRLPLAEITGVAIAVVCYAVLRRLRGLPLRLDLRGGLDRTLFRESLPIGAGHFIWAVRMYLPIVLLLVLAGGESTALFGVSHRIVMVFQAFLNVYFTNLFPTFSQVAHDRSRLGQMVDRSLLLTVAPTATGAAAMILVAPYLLGLIYGSAFVRPDSVWTLAALIWLIPILAWRHHGTFALIALNRQRDDVQCAVMGLGLLVALLVPMSAWYGARGATSAILISELATAALTWARLRSGPSGLGN
jgi:PST family polysaccharide transporter